MVNVQAIGIDNISKKDYSTILSQMCYSTSEKKSVGKRKLVYGGKCGKNHNKK